MNEEVVELMVRMVCGESSEPPLRGLVQIGRRRFRVWKHGARLRVESDTGELRAIRGTDRAFMFLEGDARPIESGPGSLAFDDEDAPAPFRLARPALHTLELDERRVIGAVERGERFGRPTATVTLDHPYHDDFATTFVLDAVTGMPFAWLEAGNPILEWLELEVLDAVDESLLTWDGETRSAGWFAYSGSYAEVSADDDAETPDGFDPSPLVARVPMRVRVDSFEPGSVAIDLESDLFVSVRGYAAADAEVARGATEVWTTDDGWTWEVHATGVEDPDLLDALRARIVAWRDHGASGAR